MKRFCCAMLAATMCLVMTACSLSSPTSISDKEIPAAIDGIKDSIGLTELEGLKSVAVYRSSNGIMATVNLQTPFDFENFKPFAADSFNRSNDSLVSLGKEMAGFSCYYYFSENEDDYVYWFSTEEGDGIYSDKRTGYLNEMSLSDLSESAVPADTRTFSEIPVSEAGARISAASREDLDEFDISNLTSVTNETLSDYIDVVDSTTQNDYEYISAGSTYSGSQTDCAVVVKKTLTNADAVKVTQLLRKDNIEVSVRFFMQYDTKVDLVDNLPNQVLRLFARENILGKDDIIQSGELDASYSPLRYIVSRDAETEIAVHID